MIHISKHISLNLSCWINFWFHHPVHFTRPFTDLKLWIHRPLDITEMKYSYKLLSTLDKIKSSWTYLEAVYNKNTKIKIPKKTTAAWIKSFIPIENMKVGIPRFTKINTNKYTDLQSHFRSANYTTFIRTRNNFEKHMRNGSKKEKRSYGKVRNNKTVLKVLPFIQILHLKQQYSPMFQKVFLTSFRLYIS